MSDRPLHMASDDADDPSESGGEWGGDSLQEARDTILAIMRGAGGRNAQTRLQAAKTVLDAGFLEHLSDEALVAEFRRRRKGRDAS